MKDARIIVGVTGASGSVYGWRLLEKLREQPHVETHLILSRSGERNPESFQRQALIGE